MRSLFPPVVALCFVLALPACSLLQPKEAPPPMPADVALPDALPETGPGQTAEALDQTSEAELAEALQPAETGARVLGTVVVALGSPAEQGFWLRSELVSVAGKGRVELPGGASVAVDLLPGTGGALLSLAAFRALGLGLTDLPEVTVYID